MQAETTVSMVNDERGRPVYAVAMIEDVTEQRRLESQLQQVLRLESVGQLAGGVAHNFNNALTAISGYSELLARRFSSEDPALRDLEQIQRVAERSAQLTRQLLAFSRHEDVHPSIFNVNEAVESTRDLLSPLLDDQLRFRVRLDQGLPSVNADRSQLEQIITNLVINARDAMPEGGLLTIDTEAVDVDEAAARVNPRGEPRPIRPSGRARYWGRNGGGHGRANLRTLLHNEGTGGRDWAWSGHGSRSRQAGRRVHHRGEHTRRRIDLRGLYSRVHGT